MSRHSIERRALSLAGIAFVLLLLPGTPVKSAPQLPSANSGQLGKDGDSSPDTALSADLREAIQMLAEGQTQLLIHDFLPREMAFQMSMRAIEGRREFAESDSPNLLQRPEIAGQLTAHLAAALQGKRTYNRNSTLVQIHYVIKPTQIIPPSTPENLPDFSRPPTGSTRGLGSDAAQALTRAVSLLNEDRFEEFVRAMYPLGELGQLTQGDAMTRLVFRIKSVPAMKTAMIQDLTAAAAVAGKSEIEADRTMKIPLTHSAGGSDRFLRLELVQGDWRFSDSSAQIREKQQELVQQPIPGITVPGTEGSLVLQWDRDLQSWRLTTMPDIRFGH